MPLLLIIIALALIFGSLFSIEYFFHKASLSLFFKSPQIDKELTLDDSFTLKKVEESVSESQSAKTTGKKTIGTKAKGEATIFNLEKNERNLKQGTIIVSDKGVKFTLDSDAKIASASSSTTSGGDVTIVTGKQRALLTASELGKSGNIEKNTTLRMEGVSTDSLRATAEKTFTGGTEEDVQTVSKSDMDKLTKAVQDKIKKRGDEIVGKKLAGSKVVDDLTEITVTKTDFSKELSEEANDVTLKITAKVTFFTYQDADIRKTINDALSEAIPENFKLEEGDISYEILKADDEDDKVSLTLKVKAKPQREIDIKSLQKAVSGKKTSELEEFLKRNYDIDGYNVQINTTLPLFKSRLPFVSGNIKVQTKVL